MSSAQDRNQNIFHDQGFTLIEIAVAVTALGFLIAMTAPMIKKSLDKAESQVVINDLRVFSEAFNRYNMEKNLWPETPTLGNHSLQSLHLCPQHMLPEKKRTSVCYPACWTIRSEHTRLHLNAYTRLCWFLALRA